MGAKPVYKNIIGNAYVNGAFKPSELIAESNSQVGGSLTAPTSDSNLWAITKPDPNSNQIKITSKAFATCLGERDNGGSYTANLQNCSSVGYIFEQEPVPDSPDDFYIKTNNIAGGPLFMTMKDPIGNAPSVIGFEVQATTPKTIPKQKWRFNKPSDI